jgi:predicted SnoaL-like aldol condensation-catalyzing enzyme
MQPSPMSATATSSTIQTRPMVRTASESSSASCARNSPTPTEIKRSFVDGDYVILHVHAVREPGSRGNAIVDIFKLENGKVVEHWDVVQAIPETPANNNTMF